MIGKWCMQICAEWATELLHSPPSPHHGGPPCPHHGGPQSRLSLRVAEQSLRKVRHKTRMGGAGIADQHVHWRGRKGGWREQERREGATEEGGRERDRRRRDVGAVTLNNTGP